MFHRSMSRVNPGSPIMTYEEASALGTRILGLTKSEYLGLRLSHAVPVITHVANGQVLMSDDGDHISLMMFASTDGRTWANATINQLDDASVRNAVGWLDTTAKGLAGEMQELGIVRRAPPHIPQVHLWRDPTSDAIASAATQERAAATLVDTIRAAGFNGAGYVGLVARSQFQLDTRGINAYYCETDAYCTATARSADGTSSGWAGSSARDWTHIDPREVARRAADIATRAASPVAFEPGRRVAVLSPEAFGALARMMAPAFYAATVDAGTSPLSRSRIGGPAVGRRVVDPRLVITSDPDDPDGGYMPFFGSSADFNDVYEGLPLSPITWIDRGVLTNVAYGVEYGALHGKPYNLWPVSMRIAPAPGVQTQTVEEMIAGCEEGIYVNRFSDVHGVGTQSGMLTGVTRDGCFLIRDGRITKALKNFRFLESPFFALNRLEAIGVPKRVAVDESFGFEPTRPIIVPPVKIRDFNFSAMSEAV